MISYRIEGMEGLKGLRSDLRKKVEHNIRSTITICTTVLEAAAKRKAPVGATRELSRSIRAETDRVKLSGRVGLDYPGKKYAAFVEQGTRPHWPPPEPLERWASQRGIPVFLVQRAIARKGTKAQPFMEPAFTKNLNFIKRKFTDALKSIVER